MFSSVDVVFLQAGLGGFLVAVLGNTLHRHPRVYRVLGVIGLYLLMFGFQIARHYQANWLGVESILRSLEAAIYVPAVLVLVLWLQAKLGDKREDK